MTTTASKRGAQNRGKGKRWETDERAWLRKQGFDAEALRLTGTKDEGDLVVRLGDARILVEAKNAAMEPAGFVREACTEADHYAKARGYDRDMVLPIAVVKRRRMNASKAYVLIQQDELFSFLRALQRAAGAS